jgi:beta-galactosidase/beta-glucuronidase
MLYDLQTLKSLGFNMVRKHVKVEPDLFYRACDELGLLVMQDMPSLQADQLPNATRTSCARIEIRFPIPVKPLTGAFV